ncbi:MAG: molybdopterin cofactor-binding domain-containing protein, partial [Bdellovibrionia bacterium]
MKSAAATGGGLLIGAKLSWAEDTPKEFSNRDHAAAAPGQFDAWITITSENQILFVVDRAEMGQGIMTALTTIVAEELCVDPTKIHTSFAPPHSAYGNPRLFGAQMTGGSTSVAAAWQPLRKTGASARMMLIKAAAKKMG